MDDWEDDWDEGTGPTGPSRPGLVLVAIILLVPFVLLFGGGADAISALGPVFLPVAIFFAVVGLTFVLVRRWLRRRLEPGGARR